MRGICVVFDTCIGEGLDSLQEDGGANKSQGARSEAGGSRAIVKS